MRDLMRMSLIRPWTIVHRNAYSAAITIYTHVGLFGSQIKRAITK